MIKSLPFKDAVFEQFARIGKAVSSAKRLELLELLSQGERSVEVLAKEANLTVANTSQHLQVLRTARLVEAEKNGLYVTYRLADEQVGQFLRSVCQLGESRLAEVEQLKRRFINGEDDMESVDRVALLVRVQEEAVIVLDVRPAEEYQAGHIPGAVSIPLKELEQRLSELPRDQEIVAYCRGPYCILATEAVEILKSKGFHAVLLEDGFSEWRVHGLPVNVGNLQDSSLKA